MFKNILVPTDGSSLSRNAAQHAIRLAKATGASITAFHVAPTHFAVYGEYAPPELVSGQRHEREAQRVARRHLDEVQKMADEAQVPLRAEYVMSDNIAESIVRAAREYGCDSIVMASHGRRGLSKVLLGSETQKVLVESDVPVVITR